MMKEDSTLNTLWTNKEETHLMGSTDNMKSVFFTEADPEFATFFW